VRQASGVGVEVGRGEGIGDGLGVEVIRRGVDVGIGWFDGEQAVITVRSVSSIVSSFVA
jgi:hypothetical protein